ncbi:sodium-independent sulfate anion transporter isoform X1 [Pteropus alecto]|uniref:sodium-independent sulfate anion transporter isoform X1 n=1 Tax=Pteropus alecto TaxID=9402 RepID=UPI000D535565|nr:sodium-independent sulfate anion transporter isoform X1 [Pteropus alecto]
MAPMSCCCSPAAVRRRLPVLAWLPRYSLQWLKMDLIAGLSVGLTVIPQALAYAEVAGLPPQYGLYSAFMGCFVYLILGTSRDVTLGPTAIMSLLVSSYTFHEPAYAVLLAFLSGCIQLAMGFLCLGPSLRRWEGGTLASSPALRTSPSRACGPPVLSPSPTHATSPSPRSPVASGISSVCSLLAGQGSCWISSPAQSSKVSPPLPPSPSASGRSRTCWDCATPPGSSSCKCITSSAMSGTPARNALVVSFAALVAYSFEVTGHQPFILTGKIVEGLPPVQVPPFSVTTANRTVSFAEMAQDMGAGLAVVPLMGLLESIAVAKSFASQNNYRVDANQELLAIGLTNVLGSFVSSYPVTGSFGRTAVNAQSGVCTPAGGLVTGVLVLLSLGCLTSLFPYIPKAALAAVIIMAVAPLCDPRIVRTLWRVKRLDLLPLCVTFLLCFWEVQYGILAGTLVSGLILLHSVARPQMKVSEGPVLVVQPASGLHFPAVEALREAIVSRALEAPRPRCAVLDCTHVCSADYTVVLGLAGLLEDFRSHGVTLAFVGLQVPVLRVLLSADLSHLQHFPTLEEAGGCSRVTGDELGQPSVPTPCRRRPAGQNPGGREGQTLESESGELGDDGGTVCALSGPLVAGSWFSGL